MAKNQGGPGAGTSADMAKLNAAAELGRKAKRHGNKKSRWERNGWAQRQGKLDREIEAAKEQSLIELAAEIGDSHAAEYRQHLVTQAQARYFALDRDFPGILPAGVEPYVPKKVAKKMPKREKLDIRIAPQGDPVLAN